jgi:hypothetical protein
MQFLLDKILAKIDGMAFFHFIKYLIGANTDEIAT